MCLNNLRLADRMLIRVCRITSTSSVDAHDSAPADLIQSMQLDPPSYAGPHRSSSCAAGAAAVRRGSGRREAVAGRRRSCGGRGGAGAAAGSTRRRRTGGGGGGGEGRRFGLGVRRCSLTGGNGTLARYLQRPLCTSEAAIALTRATHASCHLRLQGAITAVGLGIGLGALEGDILYAAHLHRCRGRRAAPRLGCRVGVGAGVPTGCVAGGFRGGVPAAGQSAHRRRVCRGTHPQRLHDRIESAGLR